MNIKKFLQQKGIDPDKPVLNITRRQAMAGIMEAIKEYCPNVKIEKMPKEKLPETQGHI